jgi:hypothetical protein
MKADLAKRTGDLIFPRSQPTARDGNDLMTERAEALTLPRTVATALDSAVRSQRSGAKERGRIRPSSVFRVRSSRSLKGEVLERISLPVIDIAGLWLVRSSAAVALPAYLTRSVCGLPSASRQELS